MGARGTGGRGAGSFNRSRCLRWTRRSTDPHNDSSDRRLAGENNRRASGMITAALMTDKKLRGRRLQQILTDVESPDFGELTSAILAAPR